MTSKENRPETSREADPLLADPVIQKLSLTLLPKKQESRNLGCYSISLLK